MAHPDAPRLPSLAPADLDDDQRAVHAELTGGARGGVPTAPDGSLAGPFNAMLHAPAVGGPLQELGAALRTRGALPARARELAVLAVAAHHRSAFEWWAHSAIAARLGVPDELVGAVRAQDPSTRPEDAVESAVLDATRVLLSTGDLDDGQYASARHALGDTGLVELTTLLGYYALLAMQLRVFRVGLPEGAVDAWADRPV
ncbi:carboxymuconolactone decarboxylase family protein [Pseudonocardia sp. KRD291]|uniref:carboxymuconolactone decarboxylase family protein n=1 Tax=Pseudonocardia sp. KRD291 TaxID=2792007 RepID=UPI0027E26992|nr:carboxymuconolactone decarboxylase family protein [Pseudonocardia sp. KRD291]